MSKHRSGAWQARRERAAAAARQVLPFLRYAIERFLQDRGPQVASALTYTSLLGLVPLLAILLAIFSAFPAFEGLRESVKNAVLGPLMPGVAGQMQEHIDSFLANTRGLGSIGAVGLAVTSFMMVATFEGAFATIWRVREPRPLVFRVLLYWALLTMGPLLTGLSISFTSYVLVLAHESGVSTLAPQLVWLRVFVPGLIGIVAFTLLYTLIPHWPVRFRHALVGAVTATVLFEALKLGFTIYVGNGDNYRAIYGALAVLPIFLLWLYCSWCVVLFGAEVAAALPEWPSVRLGHGRAEATQADRLASALAVLWELWRLRSDGRGIRPGTLERMLGARWGRAGAAISTLLALRYIAQTERGRLLLARDLSEVPLHQLAQDLGIGFDDVEPTPPAGEPPPWLAPLHGVLDSGDRHLRDSLGISIGDLFAGKTLLAPAALPQAPRSARGS